MFTISITDKVIREALEEYMKPVKPHELDSFKAYLRLEFTDWLKKNAKEWWEGRIY